jgi:hypothetical protein
VNTGPGSTPQDLYLGTRVSPSDAWLGQESHSLGGNFCTSRELAKIKIVVVKNLRSTRTEGIGQIKQ